MSSERRPWYPWYPKDFVVDEKVQALSPVAELLYRRALDVMWQANTCQLPNVCQKLANQIGKGLPYDEFEKAWSEIQYPGFELFKTTPDGNWIYSNRLKKEAEKIESISNIRKKLGAKGGQAKAKQKPSKSQKLAKAKAKQNSSHTDTYPYTDITTIPPIPPNGLPDWLNKNLWKEFLKMRASIKKPVKSEIAVSRLLNSLKKLIDEGHSQENIIGEAIEKCWQTFYAPKNRNGPKSKNEIPFDILLALSVLKEEGQEYFEWYCKDKLLNINEVMKWKDRSSKTQ